MNEHIEDLIRQMDPALGVEVPAADSPVGRAVREAALLRGSRPRLKRGLITAVVAFFVLFGASAAAYLLFGESPTGTSVTCYSEPDLDAEIGIALDTDAGFDVLACGRYWEDGSFGDNSQVPPLVACVTPGGAIAVFPGTDQVCVDLGLALAAGFDSLAPLAELSQTLRDLGANERCIPFDEVFESIVQTVNDLGLDREGWIVVAVATPTAERPCGSHGVNAGATLVTVAPIPNSWD